MQGHRQHRKGNSHLLLQVAAILFVSVFPGAASGAEIVPHQAQYRITLESLRFQGVAMRAEGAMAIRATRDCEKWKILKELLYVVEVSDGSRIRIHTMDRVYEGLDGERMEFAGWFKVNDGARLDVRGHATLDAGDGGGTVFFRRPEDLAERLPPGTRFPMAALRETLDALGAGRPVRARDVYSGLGLSATTDVTPAKGRLKEPPNGDPHLLEGRAWLVQSTLYADTGKTGRPLVTETAEIHLNGIVSRFWSDFEMLSISGELVSVEEFAAPVC